jgi:hypothetical protein
VGDLRDHGAGAEGEPLAALDGEARRLEGSEVWARLVARWREGAALSGSSSGAMVAATWRQSVWPPFHMIPGLGLLPTIAAAPHHDARGPRALATLRTHTHPNMPIVGIEDYTALMYIDGRFEVAGKGKVTLRRGPWSQVFEPGQEVPAAAMGITPEAMTERLAQLPTVPGTAEVPAHADVPVTASSGREFDTPAAAAGA